MSSLLNLLFFCVSVDLVESFSIFDIDGDGEISVQELMSVMASVGNELSNEDAEDIFEIVDSNGKYFPAP